MLLGVNRLRRPALSSVDGEKRTRDLLIASPVLQPLGRKLSLQGTLKCQSIIKNILDIAPLLIESRTRCIFLDCEFRRCQWRLGGQLYWITIASILSAV